MARYTGADCRLCRRYGIILDRGKKGRRTHSKQNQGQDETEFHIFLSFQKQSGKSEDEEIYCQIFSFQI